MIDQLKVWVTEQLGALAMDPCADDNWQPLRGDAGFRKYFRLSVAKEKLLAVYAPPATEDSEQFMRVATHLRMCGVNTPRVLAFDMLRGFLLIEDLGVTTVFERLTAIDDPTDVYQQAFDELLKIQAAPVDQDIFPSYSTEKLIREMALFPTWFIPQLLGYSASDEESSLIVESFTCIATQLAAQPKCIVHRDFHSQNLILDHGSVGVIDFQDAVVGPITYDLVSLLRDCYIVWSPERVKRLALSYRQQLETNEIATNLSEATFLRGFDWMGIQRHIKVMGIFARLSIRDGKSKYLSDLPVVIAYFLSVASKYQELETLVEWFKEALMPLIEKQSWYRQVDLTRYN